MKDNMRFKGKRENEIHEDMVDSQKVKKAKKWKGFDSRDFEPDDEPSFLSRPVKKSSPSKRVDLKSLEDDELDEI